MIFIEYFRQLFHNPQNMNSIEMFSHLHMNEPNLSQKYYSHFNVRMNFPPRQFDCSFCLRLLGRILSLPFLPSLTDCTYKFFEQIFQSFAFSKTFSLFAAQFFFCSLLFCAPMYPYDEIINDTKRHGNPCLQCLFIFFLSSVSRYECIACIHLNK
jgi:hypothetical protein